jgi:hypothetical protein
MALPKLNVPVYETILPSTERVIKYRPFLVKEEKLLLTALEGGTGNEMPSAIKQIINNCVQTELDVDNLSTFDIEYLFLRLRAKSVGEEVTIGLKPYPCGQNDGKLCEKTTEVKINLEEVKVTKNEKHTNKIMLDDKIGVVMNYPNSSSLEKIEGDNFTVGMNLIKSSIKMIFTAEQTHERDSFNDEDLNEFLDSLNSEQFQSIRQFFDTMPKLSHTVKYTCSTCGEKKETTIEGLDSFFG